VLTPGQEGGSEIIIATDAAADTLQWYLLQSAVDPLAEVQALAHFLKGKQIHRALADGAYHVLVEHLPAGVLPILVGLVKGINIPEIHIPVIILTLNQIQAFFTTDIMLNIPCSSVFLKKRLTTQKIGLK
jgi:hypothetical protein